MSNYVRVTEIRDPQGGRNMIREGDGVKVDAGPGEKSSWKARFRYAEIDEAGQIVQITVVGGRDFNPAKSWKRQDAEVKIRTVLPHRVHRMSQAHIARKKAS